MTINKKQLIKFIENTKKAYEALYNLQCDFIDLIDSKESEDEDQVWPEREESSTEFEERIAYTQDKLERQKFFISTMSDPEFNKGWDEEIKCKNYANIFPSFSSLSDRSCERIEKITAQWTRDFIDFYKEEEHTSDYDSEDTAKDKEFTLAWPHIFNLYERLIDQGYLLEEAREKAITMSYVAGKLRAHAWLRSLSDKKEK